MDNSALRDSIRSRVQANNEKTLAALAKQARSPLGIIPVLGAGISAPFKYPQWGDFLRSVAAQLPRAKRTDAEAAIAGEIYEKAASIIAECLGPDDFQQTISEAFSDDRLRDADLSRGILGYLPLIAFGPVITTNFDRVIERAFEAAGRPFESSVLGANQDEIVPAIQQNRHVLWKIHGDRDDRRTRVFSADEYDRHYTDLPKLLLTAFLNRPAVFLGSSLETDRTCEVLRSICSDLISGRHYAFLAVPTDEESLNNRDDALRRMGVRAIWYSPGKYREIELHLADLVHAMSSVPLPSARAVIARDAPRLGVAATRGMLAHELGRMSAVDVRERSGVPPYVPIVDGLLRGRIVLFLGAYACMGRLPLGVEFYGRLTAQFGDPEKARHGGKSDDMDAPRLAQHLADCYGRDVLYYLVKQQLDRTEPDPTAVHWAIAALIGKLSEETARGGVPWIITTNYDDWMEYTLRAAGLPYHLFAYRVSDPHAGSFLYQDPDGAVSVVDRPSHFRRLSEPCTVIVKLHGGALQGIDLPDSHAFTHRDFVELAGRIPAGVPRVILDRLAKSALLFLGSGLGDDSIESLVRFAHASGPRSPSWAVMARPRPATVAYWKPLGVEILDLRLETFMVELCRRLGL